MESLQIAICKAFFKVYRLNLPEHAEHISNAVFEADGLVFKSSA